MVDLVTSTSGGCTITVEASSGETETVNVASGSDTNALSTIPSDASQYRLHIDLAGTEQLHSAELQGFVSPPSTPQNFSATPDGNSPNLSWDSVNWGGDVGHYNVYRGPAGGSLTQIAQVSGGTTSYNDTGATQDNNYDYAVEAENSAGTSNLSTRDSAVTLPNAPSSLAATSGGTNSIDLSWTDNSSVEADFRIFHTTTSGSGYTQIATNAANDTTYTHSGLTPDTTHYYIVDATNAAGISADSNEASATTDGLTITETGVFTSATATPQQPTAFASTTIGAANTASTASPFATESSSTTIGAEITDAEGTMHSPDSWALDFDGDDDYVEVSDDSSIEPANISISFWLKTDATQSNIAIVSKKNDVSSGYHVRMEGDVVSTFIGDGTTYYGTEGTTVVTDSNRHHVAVTYEVNGQVKIYIDGVEEGSDAAGEAIAYGANPMRMARGVNYTESKYFNGSIDSPRIYDRPLSSAEVSRLYEGQNISDGLVGHWKFDDPSDTTTAVDSAGSNDGTINGAKYVGWPELRETAIANETGLLTSAAASTFVTELARATEVDLYVNANAATTVADVFTVATETDVFTVSEAETTIIYLPPIPRMGLDVNESTGELHHGVEDWDT